MSTRSSGRVAAWECVAGRRSGPAWLPVGRHGAITYYVHYTGQQAAASLCPHGGGTGHWPLLTLSTRTRWEGEREGPTAWPWPVAARHDLGLMVVADARRRLAEAAREGDVVHRIGRVTVRRAHLIGRTVWCASADHAGVHAVARTWRHALATLRARLANYHVTIEPGVTVEVWATDAQSTWGNWWAPGAAPRYVARYITARDTTVTVWERRTWRAPRPRQLQQDPRLRARVRALLPATGARDSDGRLIGFKTLRFDVHEGLLISPTYRTPWPAPAAILSAHRPPEGEDLRRDVGIHACWPGHRGHPDWTTTDLPPLLHASHEVVAEVRGWGRYVAGTWGWRAEHAQVVRLLVATCPAPPPSPDNKATAHEQDRCRAQAARLAEWLRRAYPDVPIDLVRCSYVVTGRPGTLIFDGEGR